MSEFSEHLTHSCTLWEGQKTTVDLFFSHTHTYSQTCSGMKCVCVCIDITVILINPLFLFLYLRFCSHISPHSLLSFHSNHPTPQLFLIKQAHKCPFSFSSYSFQLGLQRVLATVNSSWILHSLLPLLIPRPRIAPHPAHSLLDSSSCLPPLVTPLYTIQTHRQKRAHKILRVATQIEVHMHAGIYTI